MCLYVHENIAIVVVVVVAVCLWGGGYCFFDFGSGEKYSSMTFVSHVAPLLNTGIQLWQKFLAFSPPCNL